MGKKTRDPWRRGPRWPGVVAALAFVTLAVVLIVTDGGSRCLP